MLQPQEIFLAPSIKHAKCKRIYTLRLFQCLKIQIIESNSLWGHDKIQEKKDKRIDKNKEVEITKTGASLI